VGQSSIVETCLRDRGARFASVVARARRDDGRSARVRCGSTVFVSWAGGRARGRFLASEARAHGVTEGISRGRPCRGQACQVSRPVGGDTTTDSQKNPAPARIVTGPRERDPLTLNKWLPARTVYPVSRCAPSGNQVSPAYFLAVGGFTRRRSCTRISVAGRGHRQVFFERDSISGGRNSFRNVPSPSWSG